MRRLLVTVILFALAGTLSARVDHVQISSRAPYMGGRSFGLAGPYERIQGKVFFALDPRNPHNAEIVDLYRAPANDRGDELKYRLGVSNMVMAHSAYENRHAALATEHLNSVPVGQRGWEWHYLKRQMRGLFTLEGHTKGVIGVAYSPDGTRLATASDGRGEFAFRFGVRGQWVG